MKDKQVRAVCYIPSVTFLGSRGSELHHRLFPDGTKARGQTEEREVLEKRREFGKRKKTGRIGSVGGRRRRRGRKRFDSRVFHDGRAKEAEAGGASRHPRRRNGRGGLPLEIARGEAEEIAEEGEQE